MLNAEKFKGEILSINDVFGVYKGKPVCCNDLSCVNCEFHDSESITCEFNRVNWMLSEYREPKIESEVYDLKVDDKVEVSDTGVVWRRRYFKCIRDGVVIAWNSGRTSFSANSDDDVTEWEYARIPREE